MSHSLQEKAGAALAAYLRLLPVDLDNKHVCVHHITGYFAQHAREKIGSEPWQVREFKYVMENIEQSGFCDPPIGKIEWKRFTERTQEIYGKNKLHQSGPQTVADIIIEGIEHSLAIAYLQCLMPDHLIRCLQIMHQFDFHSPYNMLHKYVGKHLLKTLLEA